MESQIEFLDKLDDYNKKLYGAALYYISCGLKVIPLRPGTKIPLSSSTGMNYHSASRTVTTIKKWFGKGGQYKDHNIGLVCGEDLFAVDVDDNSVWEKLVSEGWEHDGSIQETPRGGRHYLFKWQQGARNSSGKLAPNIDTRGSKDGKPASHIAAWPSIVKNGTYKWLAFKRVLPEIPEWICTKTGINDEWPPNKNKGSNKGNEDVGWEDLEDRVSPDKLKKLLHRIDLNAKHDDVYVIQYEDWCNCGMVIHTQYPDQVG